MMARIFAGKSHRSQIAGLVSSEFDMNTLPRMAARLSIEEILEGSSMFNKTGLMIAALVLAFPVFADAKTLYVNNSGNPTCSDNTTYGNNGATNPWCTLGRALWGSANRLTPVSSQAATAGDIVIVAAGTYTAPDTGRRFEVAFNPVNEGTSDGNRIIIQASGTVNLRSTGTSGGPIIGSYEKDYLTWDGFTIDETTYASLNSGEQSNIMVVAATGVNIQNSTSIGRTTTYANANHAGIFYHDTRGGRVYNNTIYNVQGPDQNVAGFYSYGAVDLIIENNHIHHCRNGMFIKEHISSGMVIRLNKIHDLTTYGIRLGATEGSNTNHSVYKNLIYNASIGVHTASLNVQTGNKIVNNTIYNVANGISIEGGTYEVLFYNNIIHTATVSSVWTHSYAIDDPNYQDFQHNLYYNATRQWCPESRACQNWTVWTGTWAQDRVWPQGINGVDPLFVSVTTGDFRLQAGSTARALGVDILDLDGDGSTTDIIPAGAYVTGNEIIGLISNSGDGIPSPLNLRTITN